MRWGKPKATPEPQCGKMPPGQGWLCTAGKKKHSESIFSQLETSLSLRDPRMQGDQGEWDMWWWCLLPRKVGHRTAKRAAMGWGDIGDSPLFLLRLGVGRDQAHNGLD